MKPIPRLLAASTVAATCQDQSPPWTDISGCPTAQTPFPWPAWLQTKMQPKRLVESSNHGRRQLSNARPEAPHVNGSDLLCVSFGQASRSGGAGFQQRLKGQHV